MSQIANRFNGDHVASGTPGDARLIHAANERPIRYVTTDYLATLWDERSRQVDVQRDANPDDLTELEHRQRLASQALRAYRLLSELERQLGFELALPVLGPWRGPITAASRDISNGVADAID